MNDCSRLWYILDNFYSLVIFESDFVFFGFCPRTYKKTQSDFDSIFKSNALYVTSFCL
jgi:hypothetical protein